MITEDYVSFEIAKLLKEKGFDIPCNCYGAYNGVNLTYRLCITDKYTNWNKHADKLIISCPTLQMAMKWLRETHDIDVSIVPLRSHKEYLPRVEANVTCHDGIPCKKYEQACETAIKYCLENLIYDS